MKLKSILLVDDENTILDSLGRDLGLEKFHVTKAESGEKALVELEKEYFDLVITDLAMSGINGIEVLKEAKKNDPSVCVFILTGYGDMDSAIDALRLGADDYLLKPCDTEELLIRINRCLEKRDDQKKLEFYEKILPVCCMCGDIRDDHGFGHGKGKWMKMNEYILRRTNTEVSHTYCPVCYKQILTDQNL